MESIINEENKVDTGYETISMKFKQIGDKIEGTLVNKTWQEVDKFMKPGEKEMKFIYELKVAAGTTVVSAGVTTVLTEEERWAVWGKPDAKSALDTQMKTASLGQIIGLVCEATKMSRYGNEMKLITIYKKPGLVDKEWLASPEASQLQQEEAAMPDFTADTPEEPDFSASATPTEPVESVIPTEPVATGSAVEEDPLDEGQAEILAFTKAKFGLTTDAEAKAKAMEVTDLAFLVPNYGKILEKLKTL